MPSYVSEVIAEPEFPAYSVNLVSDRYVVIGGGGGAAKTGIRNKFDIYELQHNGMHTVSELVLSHDVGEYCVSNLAAWCNANQQPEDEQPYAPTITLALGQEEKTCLVKLKPSFIRAGSESETLIPCSDKEDSSKSTNVRKRGQNENCLPPEYKSTTVNKDSEEGNNSKISFTVQQLSSTVTIHRKKEKEEVYQKSVRISPDNNLIATGGTDGHLRIWELPHMNMIHDIPAHDKEIDDLDFKSDNKEIVSVSKPSRECIVWKVKDGQQVIRLALPTNGVKYKFFRARYGCIERDRRNVCLFTISNPVSGTKPPSIVTKWCGHSYKQQKLQTLRGTLSSLAVSDNGRFLAAGTMSGSIYIMIAFSLQQLTYVEGAHGMFVTGLEWLPVDSEKSKIVRGFSEASVLSISCDNTVKVHHIQHRGTIPIWALSAIIIIFLVGVFILMNLLGF